MRVLLMDKETAKLVPLVMCTARAQQQRATGNGHSKQQQATGKQQRAQCLHVDLHAVFDFLVLLQEVFERARSALGGSEAVVDLHLVLAQLRRHPYTALLNQLCRQLCVDGTLRSAAACRHDRLLFRATCAYLRQQGRPPSGVSLQGRHSSLFLLLAALLQLASAAVDGSRHPEI